MGGALIMKRALIFFISLAFLVSIGVIKCSNDGRQQPPTTALHAAQGTNPGAGTAEE
jgi:hypothetical protein